MIQACLAPLKNSRARLKQVTAGQARLKPGTVGQAQNRSQQAKQAWNSRNRSSKRETGLSKISALEGSMHACELSVPNLHIKNKRPKVTELIFVVSSAKLCVKMRS
eukprot:1147567-Pelagomonas_calceolata.AAC.1